jgi:hypothetical protein
VHEARGVEGVGREGGDARAQGQASPRGRERRGGGLAPQAGDDILGPVGIRAGEEEDELVAARPRAQVARAQAVRESAGHQPQRLVSDGMAQGVVELLEGVDVEGHDGEGRGRPARAVDLLAQALVQRPMVEQAGDGVAQRERLEPRVTHLELGGHLVEGVGEARERVGPARLDARPEVAARQRTGEVRVLGDAPDDVARAPSGDCGPEEQREDQQAGRDGSARGEGMPGLLEPDPGPVRLGLAVALERDLERDEVALRSGAPGRRGARRAAAGQRRLPLARGQPAHPRRLDLGEGRSGLRARGAPPEAGQGRPGPRPGAVQRRGKRPRPRVRAGPERRLVQHGQRGHVGLGAAEVQEAHDVAGVETVHVVRASLHHEHTRRSGSDGQEEDRGEAADQLPSHGQAHVLGSAGVGAASCAELATGRMSDETAGAAAPEGCGGAGSVVWALRPTS